MSDAPSLTIGIEEEYLLVDRETRDLVADPDPGFHKACEAALGDQVAPEFLRCQVEIGTRPVATASEARDELARLRGTVGRLAAERGYAILAASTHPFAKWRDQRRTPKERYGGIEDAMGQNARRMLICGCHVHAAIEDEDARIDLMNQARYFLPHLLAISCSSPFWEGEDTGLASYRLTVMDALPRTGLPDVMGSFGEYRRLVALLVEAGCLEDATKIWWDLRPSDRYPTLEMRVSDVCPRIEDAVTVAALYQALLGFLWQLRAANQRWRQYPDTLIEENRWRAQRYAETRPLLDLGREDTTAVADLMTEIVALVGEEAGALGARDEVARAPVIAREGTSATRQRRVRDQALAEGADAHEAMVAVVDHLLEETMAGTG